MCKVEIFRPQQTRRKKSNEDILVGMSMCLLFNEVKASSLCTPTDSPLFHRNSLDRISA